MVGIFTLEQYGPVERKKQANYRPGLVDVLV